jgi:hypothetical protein
MKKIYLILSLIVACFIAKAQVFSGAEEIEKLPRDGAYVLSKYDTKFVEKIVTKNYLPSLGKVEQKGNSFVIREANFNRVDGMPSLVYGKIFKQKEMTAIFLSVVLANGDIITNAHEKWPALGAYLTEVQTGLVAHDAVRVAETAVNDATEAHKKSVKNGEKLKNGVADNKKEKEKLLKKIEENRIELEKLLTEQETNKVDQTKLLDAITAKKVELESVKMKVTK